MEETYYLKVKKQYANDVIEDLKMLDAIEVLQEDPDYLQAPSRIATRKNGKYTEVKDYEFN